jgi:hypothetical protein
MASKKSKRDRDDGDEPKRSLVNYTAISDRQVGDKRFERERAYKLNEGAQTGPAVSSTFDAFQRMAAGLEGRSIADKIADPNRPTWEQYKKENEEKLDLVSNDVRKMVEYRAQLDKERDERLQRGTNHGKKSKAISDSSDSDSSDSGSDSDSSGDRHKRKKDKKKDKKSKKHKDKKEKKSKKKRKHDSDSDGGGKHSKKKSHGEEGGGSMRLSDFMKAGYDSDA